MKQLIIILLLPLFASSQITTEHLIEVNKSYNPLFGSSKGAIRISLDLIYKDGGDSVLYAVFDIGQTKSKVDGGFNNASIFNDFIGFTSSRHYSIKSTQGFTVIDRPQLDSLINFFSRTINFSNQTGGYNKSIMFQVDKIIFGVDLKFTFDKNTKDFYIKIEDSPYRLSGDEFSDLLNTFKDMKQTWDKFLTYHVIITPIK